MVRCLLCIHAVYVKVKRGFNRPISSVLYDFLARFASVHIIKAYKRGTMLLLELRCVLIKK